MTIHEMPARAWDAWHEALGCVPVRIDAHHHAAGVYLDRPIGAIVFENQRFVDRDHADCVYIRGELFRRGPDEHSGAGDDAAPRP